MSLYILFIHGSWHRRPPLENAQPWAGARLSVQCITIQVYFTQILVKTGRPYIIVYGVHLSYSFDYIALALSEEVLGSRPLSSTVVKSPAIGLIIMAIKAKAPEHTPEPP